MSSGDESSRSRAETYAEFAALVGTLAHEIRNPLSTIRLTMELLAEDFEATDPQSPTKHRDRRAKAKIELVRQECDRLQKLLGDFLDFARQESLVLEPGSLNAEIEQLLDFCATGRGKQCRNCAVSRPRVADGAVGSRDISVGRAEPPSQRSAGVGRGRSTRRTHEALGLGRCARTH